MASTLDGGGGKDRTAGPDIGDPDLDSDTDSCRAGEREDIDRDTGRIQGWPRPTLTPV